MIAAIDEIHGPVADPDLELPAEVKVLPASHPLAQAAVHTAAALIAIKDLANTVRQVALSQVLSGQPASAVAPLVRTHAALMSAHAALSQAVASLVRAAETVPQVETGADE
jgi:hypothetical protein